MNPPTPIAQSSPPQTGRSREVPRRAAPSAACDGGVDAKACGPIASIAADLRCPMCAARLTLREAGRLRCEGCAREFPVRDGIADLRCKRYDYYFNPVPRQRMREITAAMPATPWHETVRSFLAEVRHNPDWLDNLTADGRYSWKLFLDLPPEARVLDLGCGLGNLTRNIAPHVAETVAFDLTWERLEFARERLAAEGLGSRVRIVAGGDGEFLPFADDSFDCVVLSGVLEWIAADGSLWAGTTGRLAKLARMFALSLGETNPRRMQLRFLREIRRVLKRDGQIFVAIENRTNLEYALGRPDHHSGLLYGSLLPRPLANLWSIAKSRVPYRTYTYTCAGHRRLMREAGFDDVRFLGLTPGYSHLRRILPYGGSFGSWANVAEQGSLAKRISSHPWFVPALGVIATNEGAGRRSLGERLLATMAAGLGDPTLRMRSLTISGKEKTVLELDSANGPLIAKLPNSPADLACEARQAEWLGAAVSDPRLRALVPRPLGAGSLQGLSYFLESRADGVSLASVLRTAGRTAHLPQVRDALALLAGTPPPEGGRTGPDASAAAGVRDAFRLLGRHAGAAAVLHELEAAVVRRIEALHIRRCVTHGDFSVRNIFVDGDRGITLIDWEPDALAGLPVLDAINYLDSIERQLEGGTVSDSLRRLCAREWRSREELALVDDMLARSGHSGAALGVWAALYWLRHTTVRLRSPWVYDGVDVRRRIDEGATLLRDVLAATRD